MGGGYGGMGEEVRGLRSTNRKLQNSHGDVKYSIRYGVARELTCTTHGHEHGGGIARGSGGAGWKRAKGEKSGQR